MKYHFPVKDSQVIHKYGVDISLYGANAAEASVVYEETAIGHFEEFYDEGSTYTWFIIEGNGTFVINDEKIEVAAQDQIVVPPSTRVHYFGKLKMVLAVSPAFNEQNVRHVREVSPEESPYTDAHENPQA